jgi:hypothetical protein
MRFLVIVSLADITKERIILWHESTSRYFHFLSLFFEEIHVCFFENKLFLTIS